MHHYLFLFIVHISCNAQRDSSRKPRPFKSVNDELISQRKSTSIDLGKFKSLSNSDYKNLTILKQKSDNVFLYMDSLKTNLVKLNNNQHQSDIDILTRYMITEKRGDILHNKLIVLENAANTFVKNDTKLRFKFYLPTSVPRIQGQAKQSWSEYYFAEVPIIAGLTTKMQNDVLNLESQVSSYYSEKLKK